MLSNPLLLAGGGADYQIQRSLRLRASATAYLNRTPAGAGNRKVFTISAWVKPSASNLSLLDAGAGTSANTTRITLDTNGNFNIVDISASVIRLEKISTRKLRDPSAWGHFVVSFNSGTITAHWNNEEITSWTTNTNTLGAGDTQVNAAVAHYVNKVSYAAAYSDGYVAEYNFIDGQALTPSSFGLTDPTTGVWTAKKYTGTYGTNGFYLPFTDNTALTTASNVGIGKDFSGNGNYWVTNNVSITAGATYDSMLDVPLAYGTTDRGNYATLNPLLDWHTNGSNFTFSDGNLAVTEPAATTYGGVASSIAVSTGKWYCEITASAVGASQFTYIGISELKASPGYPGASTFSYGYRAAAFKTNAGVDVAYGATYTSGDIIGVAFDADAGSLTFYKNGVSQGVAFTGIAAGNYVFAIGDFASTQVSSFVANFGQRTFSYTPPTGFKALHTGNLSAPTILKPSTQFMAVVDVGATIKTTAEAVFSSNFFEMIKDRANANNWQQIDSVRGSSAVLQSNTTAAETTYTAPSGNSVAAVWKAGGTAVTNTAGSISAQVSANASAGFSIVTYTGTGANATVGHGLGVAPKMVIVKNRNSAGATDWLVYHANLTSAAYALVLSGTNAQSSSVTYWNSTAPTSSLFSIGTSAAVNESAKNLVAYCFAEIAGYSKFGSYTGNGSADGPFVYCGFRPRWVMWKRSDAAATAWHIEDAARNTYNAVNSVLFPDSSIAEYTNADRAVDFLSNGFKFRGANVDVNASSGTYIFMALAENPFQYSLAR